MSPCGWIWLAWNSKRRDQWGIRDREMTPLAACISVPRDIVGSRTGFLVCVSEISRMRDNTCDLRPGIEDLRAKDWRPEKNRLEMKLGDNWPVLVWFLNSNFVLDNWQLGWVNATVHSFGMVTSKELHTIIHNITENCMFDEITDDRQCLKSVRLICYEDRQL